jgi:hypothetical protein
LIRIFGEGALLIHASGILPLWLELTLQTDSHYPLARNIALIVAFFCVPYALCLLLSHRLYRLTGTAFALLRARYRAKPIS